MLRMARVNFFLLAACFFLATIISSPRAEYQMRSPMAYAGSFKSPVRIYHATMEPHFHLSSVKTAALARERGLDVEAMRIEGNHFSALQEERTRAIAFFRAHERR